ncbi:hypothetical protein [Chryseobacterium paludis]|uniref:hypothetical protein n=1 Tax=Chryseobacterium paludis TaxID=2956784 RepID=UPI0021BECB80|nr:hypothetical protein [Chryseobacterium paludis]
MIDFVSDKKEFEDYKLRYSELFNSDKEFCDNNFHENFKYFLGFEFDYIFHKSFFEKLKKYVSHIEGSSVVFYTLEPSPEEYFYKNFKKYNVLNIDLLSTDEELTKIMMENPSDSGGISMAMGSDDIAIFSKSKEWAIIGSRDWEIAIVGFTSLEMREKFLESFGTSSDMFTTVKEQVEILDEMLHFNDVAKTEYAKIVANYSERI